jgi:hypothetical protein
VVSNTNNTTNNDTNNTNNSTLTHVRLVPQQDDNHTTKNNLVATEPSNHASRVVFIRTAASLGLGVQVALTVGAGLTAAMGGDAARATLAWAAAIEYLVGVLLCLMAMLPLLLRSNYGLAVRPFWLACGFSLGVWHTHWADAVLTGELVRAVGHVTIPLCLVLLVGRLPWVTPGKEGPDRMTRHVLAVVLVTVVALVGLAGRTAVPAFLVRRGRLADWWECIHEKEEDTAYCADLHQEPSDGTAAPTYDQDLAVVHAVGSAFVSLATVLVGATGLALARRHLHGKSRQATPLTLLAWLLQGCAGCLVIFLETTSPESIWVTHSMGSMETPLRAACFALFGVMWMLLLLCWTVSRDDDDDSKGLVDPPTLFVATGVPLGGDGVSRRDAGDEAQEEGFLLEEGRLL